MNDAAVAETPPLTAPTPGHLRRGQLVKYAVEFASVFLAVFMAFALNNYSAERRDRAAEHRILVDISTGLDKDLVDIEGNILGHRNGIKACDYFRRWAVDQPVGLDSFRLYYSSVLRDYINAQNTAGYANLKSRGLEIIRDDSLRNEVVSLYEYDYNLVRKLEESYAEQQFFAQHYDDLVRILTPFLTISEDGRELTLGPSHGLAERDRKDLMIILYSVMSNRQFTLQIYSGLETRLKQVQTSINRSFGE